MGANSKVVIGLIMIAVLMIVFPLVMNATHDLQTDNQTDATLALGGTPPAGTCVLTEDLFSDNTDNVVSVTGDKPEALTVTGYTPATHTLAVTGVTTSENVTVVYKVDALTDYTGLGTLVGMTPLLIWIGILASVLGGIYFSVRGR